MVALKTPFRPTAPLDSSDFHHSKSDPDGKAYVLDAAGNLKADPTYSEYGNPWTFTGRRLDGETGLMYYRNRIYSVDLGRFVGRDVEYNDGLNLYEGAFATRGVDPLGLKFFGPEGPKEFEKQETLGSYLKVKVDRKNPRRILSKKWVMIHGIIRSYFKVDADCTCILFQEKNGKWNGGFGLYSVKRGRPAAITADEIEVHVNVVVATHVHTKYMMKGGFAVADPSSKQKVHPLIKATTEQHEMLHVQHYEEWHDDNIAEMVQDFAQKPEWYTYKDCILERDRLLKKWRQKLQRLDDEEQKHKGREWDPFR